MHLIEEFILLFKCYYYNYISLPLDSAIFHKFIWKIQIFMVIFLFKKLYVNIYFMKTIFPELIIVSIVYTVKIIH